MTGKIYNSITIKTPITKGWSADKKYKIATTLGETYLLRISDISFYNQKKSLFETMKKLETKEIPMCLPIEFGTCGAGVYSIQSWIDGVDLETILPLSAKTTLSKKEQYALGLQAGKILKKIHGIPIPEQNKKWEDIFNRRINEIIKAYGDCELCFDGDEKVIDFIENRRYMLEGRSQSFLLGDYNILNMMYENDSLKIIDFDRYEVGDPWNEFNCIVWSAMASPYFATGQIDAYLGGEIPAEFFDLVAVYISILLLSLMSSWAVTSDYGRAVMMNLSQLVLKWFDDMKNPIPTWYLKNMQSEARLWLT